MRRLCAWVFVGVLLATYTAGSGSIPAESRLYIEPMPNDLHVYIKAEIIKRLVPIQVVSSAEDADLIMRGVSEGKEKKAWHEGWLTAQTDKVTGAIEITDLSGNLLWAAESGDRSLWFPGYKRGGQRKVAERLVKQMKKAIGNRPKVGTTRIGSGPQDWWHPVNPDTQKSQQSEAADGSGRIVRILDAGSEPVPLAPGQVRKEVSLSQGMSPSDVEELLGKPDSFEGSGTRLRYQYSDMNIEFVGGKLETVAQSPHGSRDGIGTEPALERESKPAAIQEPKPAAIQEPKPAAIQEPLLGISATKEGDKAGPPYTQLASCAARFLWPGDFKVLVPGIAASPSRGASGDGFMKGSKFFIEDFGVVKLQPDGRIENDRGFMTYVKGELIEIKQPAATLGSSDDPILQVENASSQIRIVNIALRSILQHNVTRGKGAFEHQSPEYLNSSLHVPLDMPCSQFKEYWSTYFAPVDADEKRRFLEQYPSGVFVQELVEGMSPAEVEAILGAPERKAKIGDKLIYFYPRMKLTFVGGALSDIE